MINIVDYEHPSKIIAVNVSDLQQTIGNTAEYVFPLDSSLTKKNNSRRRPKFDRSREAGLKWILIKAVE